MTPLDPSDPDRDGTIPERFGRFRLLRRLSRGPRRQVFLAHDQELDRRVVLKILPFGSIHFTDPTYRLMDEARAVSRLNHPGICPLFDAGEEGGVPYLVMPFLEGETLAERIRERRREGAGCPDRGELTGQLSFFEKAARSLEAAHLAGLVHRDIKPANLMVTPDGNPVILDFGLARVEGTVHSGRAEDLQFQGTPGFIAPEQLTGAADRVTRQVDIYGLGVSLYQALILEPPFAAPTLEQLNARVLKGEYTHPSAACPGIPGDLDRVIRTAMHRDPARRYLTAGELADDLGRVREHRPIHAVRPTLRARVGSWVRRNPALALTFLALVVALAITVWTNILLDGASRSFRAKALAGASSRVFSQDEQLALYLARRAVALHPDSDTVSQLQNVVQELQHDKVLTNHPQVVFSHQFTMDGQRILTTCQYGAAYLWSRDGKLLVEFTPAKANFTRAAISPDGQLIIAHFQTSTPRLFDGDGNLVGRMEGHTEYVSGVRFFPDRKDRILTVSKGGTIMIWNRQGKRIRTFAKETGLKNRVLISADGRFLLGQKGSAELVLWNRQGKLLHRGTEPHQKPLCWHPHRPLFLTTQDRRHIALWQVDQGGARIIRVYQGHRGLVTTAAFSPSGTHFTSGSDHGIANQWDLESGKRTRKVNHNDPISGVEYSPDGKWILINSSRKVLSLAHHRRRVRARIPLGVKYHYSAGFTPDGRHLAFTGGNKLFMVKIDHVTNFFQLDLGSSIKEARFAPRTARLLVVDHRHHYREVTYDGVVEHQRQLHRPLGLLTTPDPSGPRIVARQPSTITQILDRAGAPLHTLKLDETEGAFARCAPNGRFFLLLGKDRRTYLFTQEGKRLKTLEGITGPVPGRGVTPMYWAFSGRSDRFLHFIRRHRIQVCDLDRVVIPSLDLSRFEHPRPILSPDGKVLLITGNRGKVTFLRVDDPGTPLSKRMEGVIHQACFDPSGPYCLVGRRNGSVLLLDYKGQVITETAKQLSSVSSLAISPDGSYLAVGHEQGKVRIWSREGRLLMVLGPHHLRATRLQFSPDSRLLYSRGGNARLWRLRIGDLLQQARRAQSQHYAPDNPDLDHYRDLLR